MSIEHQGKTYEVECDGFDSILDAAIDAGIEDLSYDCKMGVCMTCPSKVTGGKVTQDGAMLSDDVCAQIQGYMDHLPTYLDPPQASSG